jgi:hypothetical protein
MSALAIVLTCGGLITLWLAVAAATWCQLWPAWNAMFWPWYLVKLMWKERQR